MNASTTNILGADYPKLLVQWMLDTVDRGTKQAYSWIWSAIKELLITHSLSVSILLVVILILAILNYFVTGRWGWLGSVLYNYLYFGTLLMIALIFGSDVFASDYFKIVLVLLYITCFTIVGIILKKTGIRKVR